MSLDLAVLLIRAGGVYCLLFALFHLFFHRLFDWDEELSRLGPLNRAIVPVLNLSLTCALAIFAVLSLAFAPDLATTGLGTVFLLLVALFWLARAIEQAVFFKLRRWVSRAFFALFLAGAALYALPLIRA
ncbi:MAG: hypothetical protein R3325_10535 [Thermoanaerobaculia bacterium]|nr:hypothetical protein [Thermoanaerobaculia bacterium]